MSAFKVVIPARYGSTRLPGKPLLRIAGRAMVVRVARQARRAGADEVIVATDDKRVAEAVTDAGYDAVMTDPDHGSGTDRVWEVARQRADWGEQAVVINVQGDEPLIAPEIIAQLAAAVAEADDAGMATLCEPIASPDDLLDPNVVKVVRDAANFALYFSRSPIPQARDGYPDTTARLWRRHIGIYGYRLGALRRFVSLPPSAFAHQTQGLAFLHRKADVIDRLHVGHGSLEQHPGGDREIHLEVVHLQKDVVVVARRGGLRNWIRHRSHCV